MSKINIGIMIEIANKIKITIGEINIEIIHHKDNVITPTIKQPKKPSIKIGQKE